MVCNIIFLTRQNSLKFFFLGSPSGFLIELEMNVQHGEGARNVTFSSNNPLFTQKKTLPFTKELQSFIKRHIEQIFEWRKRQKECMSKQYLKYSVYSAAIKKMYRLRNLHLSSIYERWSIKFHANSSKIELLFTAFPVTFGDFLFFSPLLAQYHPTHSL